MLDTHAFIWAESATEKLSDKVRLAINNTSNSLHLSYASIWEMQIKAQNRKLILEKPLDEMIRYHQTQNGLILETIDLPDILFLDQMPFHHRDPFDRMIIAQTMQRGFHLVTVDEAMEPYGVPMFW